MLRGLENGEVVDKRKIISSNHAVSIHLKTGKLLGAAENPSMELIVSNTTEAGIESRKKPSMLEHVRRPSLQSLQHGYTNVYLLCW